MTLKTNQLHSLLATVNALRDRTGTEWNVCHILSISKLISAIYKIMHTNKSVHTLNKYLSQTRYLMCTVLFVCMVLHINTLHGMRGFNSSNFSKNDMSDSSRQWTLGALFSTVERHWLAPSGYNRSNRFLYFVSGIVFINLINWTESSIHILISVTWFLITL